MTGNGNGLKLSDVFNVIIRLTVAFGAVAFVAEVVNAGGWLPQAIDNSLPADAFKILFGVLVGLLDPKIGRAIRTPNGSGQKG